MKQIFDFLRKISGGTLTQKQVDAANQVIATATDSTVADMLGIAIDQMAVSLFGVDLICDFEGKRLVAYDDGVGVWTIGFGTTIYPNGIKVKKGDTCTEAQAKSYMAHDLKKFEQAVNGAVNIPLNQNQFDALVSLAYNIGTGAFNKSTLVKKLNAGDIRGAADQFDVWVNAGGKRMQGLVNRRAKEKEVFLR
ncbi:glycoside hydrolase family protein [Acinetobacter bohemicus]|mgnify:FL=1|uniref:glycoside hydrolase family protein n=1 Tax=Acinetobacter bohemicus TaxID=1435036 RepID=UPI00192BF9F7|nr:glycoside hydrolase family protein [Acinetobacter bohemicus]CAD9197566.1 Lysozyme [Acinetobacter bohemicus]